VAYEAAAPLIAGCWKSPPASFSHRSDPQRTPEGTPPAFTRCGLAERPFWASCDYFDIGTHGRFHRRFVYKPVFSAAC